MPRMALLRYLLFPLLLLCGQGMAMPQEHPEPVRLLNIRDGLPQSYITGLVQDSTGFVWIGTKDGLAKYDGRGMKLFQHVPGDTASLTSNVITGLYLDREQRLWIWYGQGDIDILHTRTEAVTHFNADPAYRKISGRVNNIATIQEDAGGCIWIGSTAQDFWRCDLQRHTARHFTYADIGLAQRSTGNFTITGDTLWMNTSQGLAILDTRAQNPVAKPVVPPGIDPAYHRWGFLWSVNRGRGTELVLAGDTGIAWYYPAGRTARFYPVTCPTYIYVRPSATSSPSGTIYISVNDFIYSLSLQGELSLWRSHNPFHDAISMMVDKGGVLWVGGNATGIQQYDLRLKRMHGQLYQQRFKSDVFTRVLGLPQQELEQVPAITDDYAFRWAMSPDGKLWLGNGSAGMAAKPKLPYYENGHITNPDWRYADTISQQHGLISAVGTNDSNLLWGIDKLLHLYRFDRQTGVVTTWPAVPLPAGARVKAVNSLIVDGKDTLWVSTDGVGLFRYILPTRQVQYYGEGAGKLSVTCMAEDRRHRDYLWVGSLGEGLLRVEKSTGAVHAFTTANGLPNNTVYAVLQDRDGQLWCSSNKGIFAYNPATGAVRTFTMQDGLADDEFNRYHFLQLPDGRMLFGGVNGYVVFDPMAIKTDDFRPDVALTSISINNQPADYGIKGSPLKAALNSLPELVLLPRQNFISFEFAALEYNLPEKIHYKYMLRGLDEYWVDAGTRNIANYTNIPPGNYELLVMASNTAGMWSSKVKRLRIIILPPYWRTWWFALLVLVTVAGLLYLLFRQRMSAVRRGAKQRMAIERMTMELESEALRSQMNPHFIFNCLNSIKALIQDDEGVQAVSYLTTFAKLIRSQLNNEVREVSLYKELETCRLYVHMESLRFKDRIDVRIVADPDVDWHGIKVPPLILQPLIENAIWHGILPKPEGGTVTVTVKEENGTIICTVDDDGIGRKEAARARPTKNATHESKGLALIRQRLEVHSQLHQQRSTFEVRDKTGPAGNTTGTCIVITFKKRNDRPDY